MSRDEVVVETHAGRVQGLRTDGVCAFLGIPYAAPATGEGRFRPPAETVPWIGVRDTSRYGARAPQCDGSFALAPEISRLFLPVPPEPMAEDCLVLNVWTSACDHGKRPVMVWLHGGGFITGSGADPWTHGTRLAQRREVVVVTVNHRLGALGYLHLEDLVGSEFAESSLVGMLDIVAALRWVRDNVGCFGGDPSNVTVFGESGGGAKVAVLMAMPAARGLFGKAIIQSGPAVAMADRADGNRTAELFLRELDLPAERAHELRSLPLERLLAAQARVIAATGTAPFAERRRHGFNPVRGQPGFPTGPFEPGAPAISADVPLLIGTNRHEMTLFFAAEPWFSTLDDAELMSRLRDFVGDRAVELSRAYRRLRPTATATELFVDILTAQGMTLPSLTIADRKAHQHAAPVYCYLFAHESPALSGRLRSAHIVEIPYVFDTVEDAPFVERSPSAAVFSAQISTAWTEFARSGRPGAPGLPVWPSYDTGTRATMVLDAHSRVVHDPYGEERDVWLTPDR